MVTGTSWLHYRYCMSQTFLSFFENSIRVTWRLKASSCLVITPLIFSFSRLSRVQILSDVTSNYPPNLIILYQCKTVFRGLIFKIVMGVQPVSLIYQNVMAQYLAFNFFLMKSCHCLSSSNLFILRSNQIKIILKTSLFKLSLFIMYNIHSIHTSSFALSVLCCVHTECICFPPKIASPSLLSALCVHLKMHLLSSDYACR